MFRAVGLRRLTRCVKKNPAFRYMTTKTIIPSCVIPSVQQHSSIFWKATGIAVTAALWNTTEVWALEDDEITGDIICRAIVQNDLKTLKKLAEQPNFNPNVYHRYGWTPLHVAIIQDNQAIVKLLLEKGADPNLTDQYYPQSHQAANTRQVDFSEDLLPYRDYRDYTALHYAVIICNPEIVEMLLDHLADPFARNSHGLSAREYLYYVERYTGEQNLEIEEMLYKKEASYPKDKTEHEEKTRKAQLQKEKEYRKKHPLEDALKSRIVGQLGPIHALASAVRRKQNGWHDEEHPLVFLFCGSSGVGKTELAKVMAQNLHGKQLDKGFIRIDMSEFQHKHDVSRFIGSPPGYVGYDEGGQLTEKLKECPNAVVLLDEVEKAHPDVLTIMLQLFDEGRITDGKGTTVECKDAIFIMTSNLAQHEIADEAELLRLEASVSSDAQTGVASTERLTEEERKRGHVSLSRQFIEHTIYPVLYSHFKRDEFLGRINEVLFFLPFSMDELREITSRELSRWAEKARQRHGITVSWDNDVVDTLAEGYNIRYGARSIKYEVERKVVNLMAKAHENDEVLEGGRIHVVVDNVFQQKSWHSVVRKKEEARVLYGNWLDKLPASWAPYAFLTRIDKPIGTWLLFWPCAWSITMAGYHTGASPVETASMMALFGTGALTMRGAGCTINDLWDRDIDDKVERTKIRPIAAGLISPRQAIGFLGLQLSVGLAVLTQLDMKSILLGASSLSLVVTYPLMKRVTYWPQTVLGLAFNWGALLGWSAMTEMDLAVTLPLYAGGVCWTLVYDTIYAHQDKKDDIKVGVKSTALRFGEQTPQWLAGFSTGFIGLSALSGYMNDQGPFFYAGVLATAAHLAWQLKTVDYNQPADCWKKFKSNTWTGAILWSGIAADSLCGAL
ncbi:P-loop containing nucleoside triphosphate hydrolase protein [Sporodiniella umbellata]|nr:P-loop containing nucleoside triphosphate hydrolase protein [Sporodiniella umbellata]